LSKPLVKIVIPFAWDEAKQRDTKYEIDLRDSLLAQHGRGESFDIFLVFVLQERGGEVHTLQDWSPLENKVLIFNADDYDYPTTFHQAELGFKQCLDADYCMYMTANDTLAPLFIISAIKRMRELDAKVVYADTLYVDRDMVPFQCNKPVTKFDPFKWFEDGVGKTNSIPDICLLDPSVLERVPFEAKWKRGAFTIWWYRIWEEFGHPAFAYVNTIGCLYRVHDNHLSHDMTWCKDGVRIADAWVNSRPWMKWTGFAK